MRQNDTVLITGGTRGIGKAIALHLGGRGVRHFFLNYVENDGAALATQAALLEMGCTAHLLKFNLAFPAEVGAMFREAEKNTERLDFFVHCAALTVFKPFIKVKPNQWDLTMNISARSFLQCAQNCLPLMKNGGRIVAISSTGSQRFNQDYGALGVAKSTLESMVRYLAVELAGLGVQVNGVVAGLVEGEKLPPFPEIEAVRAETLRRTPAKRLGSPSDVAKAVAFLLLDAEWVVGQNLIVDGGYCLT